MRAIHKKKRKQMKAKYSWHVKYCASSGSYLGTLYIHVLADKKRSHFYLINNEPKHNEIRLKQQVYQEGGYTVFGTKNNVIVEH